MQVSKSGYDFSEMKKSYPYLSCVALKEIELMKVKNILHQTAYELIRRLEYKKVDVKKRGQSIFHLIRQLVDLCLKTSESL